MIRKDAIRLISKEKCQIRDNALEAARVAANKKMNKIVPETSYKLTVKLYPHTVISENKMLAAAGADRLQEGMRRAYGKPMGLAARVKIGTVLYEISTYERFTADAKRALKTASSKPSEKSKRKVSLIQLKIYFLISLLCLLVLFLLYLILQRVLLCLVSPLNSDVNKKFFLQDPLLMIL